MSDKVISIGFTNEEFKVIQQKAESEDMSISMFCKSKILSESEFGKYYKLLIAKVKEYPVNVKFTIRDIIGDETWDNIPKGIKLALGRRFYSQANGQIIDGIKIKIEGYGAAKTMRYSIIEDT